MRGLAFGLLTACTAPAATVPLESRLSTPVASHGTLLGGCVIVGTGERRREGDAGAPFDVYESDETREAAFVIAHPEVAHVTWSRFPERADHGRARVAIGGRAHVRYEGYAELYGRTFTTTRRMDSVRGHLWAQAGAPIDVMSVSSDGTLFARAPTPFGSPRAIVVQGYCADVRYDPDAPHPANRRAPGPLTNRETSLQLFTSRDAARPFTIVHAPDHTVGFDLVEPGGDRVHVRTEAGHVAIDAWAPDVDLVTDALREPPASDVTEPGSVPTASRYAVRMRVVRDSPLFSGWEPEPVRGAFVEASAVVLCTAQADPKSVFVSFVFADDFIRAPEGVALWIAKDALEPFP